MSVPFVAEFVICFPIRRYFLPYSHMRYEESFILQIKSMVFTIQYLIFTTLHISYKCTLVTHKMQRRRNGSLQQNSLGKQYVENYCDNF